MNIKELIVAVERVVDYLWEDEQRHYSECEDEGKSNHIYHTLVELRKYIKFLKKSRYTIIRIRSSSKTFFQDRKER